MHKNISGQKFGMLTALHLVEPHVSPNGKRVTMWMCKCECGNTKAIRYSSLVNGETKSCGCATKKFISINNNKHHWLSRSRLCGAIHDRDINAAINIRNEGMRLVTA